MNAKDYTLRHQAIALRNIFLRIVFEEESNRDSYANLSNILSI